MAVLYREGGLLHLLALSGAHLGSLWWLVRGILFLLAPWTNRSAFGRWLHRLMEQGLSGGLVAWLVWINPGNEPLERASFMFFFFHLLACRGKRVGALQLLGSCTALLVLAKPERLASDSFLLSVVATFFLFLWSAEAGEPMPRLKNYLLGCAVLPIFLLPVSAFFFAKISLMAIPNGILLGWVWSLVWVPLGFLSGIAVAIPECGRVFAGTEGVWQLFVWAQEAARPWMAWGYISVVRPTWWEVVLMEGVLFNALMSGRKRYALRGL
jgi:predicted membrane metal-binding protein